MSWRNFKTDSEGFKGSKGFKPPDTPPIKPLKHLKPAEGILKNDEPAPTPRAWIQDGELRTTGPVENLAAEIVKLTGDDLILQRRLLLDHCQAFQPSHIWRLFEQWEERAAILEYDAGLPRHEAEKEAARMYHLTAWV